MNIVFFGSSEFAIPALKSLVESGHNILCVVTQPDKEKGRHLHFEGTVVKNLANSTGLKIYQPKDINTRESVNFLKSLNAELFVVISYGQILSQEILDIPKFFAINLHASVLPKYRGAAPINWAIINGEKATGVTVMQIVKKMDAGPIISQSQSEITDEDTSVTLQERLSVLGSSILLDSIDSIEKKNYLLTPQDEKKVSFAPKLKKEDGLIDWNSVAGSIHNLVRGSLPWPGAYAHYKGKMLKLFKTGVFPAAQNQRASIPGTVKGFYNKEIIVATKKDDLAIAELQLEGSRRMSAQEFISGHKVKVGQLLE